MLRLVKHLKGYTIVALSTGESGQWVSRLMTVTAAGKCWSKHTILTYVDCYIMTVHMLLT